MQSQSEFQGLHLCFLELLLGMNSKKQHEKTKMAMDNIYLVYKTRIYTYMIMYVEKDEKKTFRMFKRLHQVYVVLSKYK